MKKISILLSLIILLCSCAQKSVEEKFIMDNVKIANNEDKIFVIEFWAPSCGPCIKLKKDIFENNINKEFVEQHFYVVQLSPADSIYKPLFKHFGLTFQSTVLYFDTDGNEMERTIGYDGNKDGYMTFLNDVIENKNLFGSLLKEYVKDSTDIKINFLLGNKFIQRYQFDDANKHFNKVLLYDSKNTLGLEVESRFKIAENDLIAHKKIDKLEEFVSLYSKNDFMPMAYVYLINEYKSKRDSLNCFKVCEDAYFNYPDNPDILNKYSWMIYSFNLTKEYSKALNMVQAAIKINPDKANYYNTEAWIYYGLRDKKSAIEAQKKAIGLNPHPTYIKELETFQEMQ